MKHGYWTNLDRDLLALGALELHPGLAALLADGSVVDLVNPQGDMRKLTVNKREGVLQGRSLTNLFKNLDAAACLITPESDSQMRVRTLTGLASADLAALFADPAAREQAGRVLRALCALRSGDAGWFELYQAAETFQASEKDDELISLSQVRDIEMFKYQIRTVKAVLHQFYGRVLLCDEVGLGKTIEAGLAMLEYLMRGLVRKILILVPPSLVDQWYFEMKRKFNQDFIRADDPIFKRMGEQAWTHFTKVIASISMAKRKSNAALITEVPYDLVIIDEAHHLKNRKTAAWQFANSLRKKYIFLLTATPVQNNLEELYNLITLLKPGQLKTYNYFKKNFIGDRAGLEAKNVSRLRLLLGGVMIRNRRSDVDVRFTRRTAVTYTLDLLAPEQELYDAISRFIRRRYLSDSPGLSRLVLRSLQEEMGSSFRAVRATLRRMLDQPLSDEDRPVIQAYLGQADQILQQHVPETKALRLLSLIRAFGDKIIVFTKYRATLDYLADYLVGQGLPVAVFHGGLRRSEKEMQIRLFQESATVLLSTESGGEGRNLQFCHGLVNYDLPWNPMAIEQRIGRIHRVGQTRDVFVYNLAAAGTVEHYILDLLDRKINLFELVVGEVDMILGDIEEETDFAEQVMNAWIQSPDPAAMEAEMTRIADKLLENKRQYQRIKELDNHLFAEIGNPTANGGAR